MKILLDPGHGAGAIHNRGSKIGNEGDNNFKMYLVLKKALENKGFEVGTTRKVIIDNPSLESRGKKGKGYDLFLSLHTNAGGGSGVEVWDDVNPKYRNKKLGEIICNSVSKTLGIPNRGVKYRKTSSGSNYYGVLRNNYAKNGMIVEFCFHDNFNEIKKYLDNLEIVAENLAMELAVYYNLEGNMENKKDYKGHWAEAYIDEVKKDGIMTGYEDGSFKPDAFITRAELAVVISKLLKKN